jgi:2-aminoadipate transaminase
MNFGGVDLDWKFSAHSQKMKSSTIREILALMAKRDIISFAGGLPAEEYFPYEELQACWRRTLENHPKKAFQYSQTEGIPEIRRTISKFLGDGVLEEEVLMTSGSQQALYLIGKVLIDPGDVVITEMPTYLGALQAWGPCEPDLRQVPMDGKGMDLDHLRETAPDSIRFIYVVPTYHNPAGESMPDGKRKELIAFAREKGTFIIEDDPYSLLRYEGPEYTPFYRLAPDITISLGTFSKIMCPGMRTAWVRAPEEVIHKLSTAKQAVDLCSPALNQFLAHEFIENGFVEKHVARMVPVYDARRRFLMECLDGILPEGASYVKPNGGMFLWVTLPDGWNSQDLLKVCIDKGVAFVPGDCFYLNCAGPPAMRLNFSKEPEMYIEKGVELLAEAFGTYKG